MFMSGSVRLDTIPDNSILIKVATPSISTYWFFKGYYNTLDAFPTPHWTKDAVPKPVETKTILYENTEQLLNNNYVYLLKKYHEYIHRIFMGFHFKV